MFKIIKISLATFPFWMISSFSLLKLIGADNVLARKQSIDEGSSFFPIEKEKNISDSIALNINLKDQDGVYFKDEVAEIELELRNRISGTEKIIIHEQINTDDFKIIKQEEKEIQLKGAQTTHIEYSYKPTKPGFYRCWFFIEKNGHYGDTTKFTIGYEPEKIIAPVDQPCHLKEFWDNTRKELSMIKPNYKITKIDSLSQNERDIYLVEMTSLNNVRIKGWYARSKTSGRFPAIVTLQWYGGDTVPPSGKDNGFVELNISERGQGLNKKSNQYGDWMLYGLQNQQQYYYRGAFMDAIRAIDFICSRLEVDTTKIFVQGISQGGALTYAAAALDHRIKACVVSVPFLSDFTEYFNIATVWPGRVFEDYLKAHSELSRGKVYETLSYFDIKNLSEWITCPLVMSVGLQDETCPPRINFAAYNRVKTIKKYFIYKYAGHSVPDEFLNFRIKFFNEIGEK